MPKNLLGCPDKSINLNHGNKTDQSTELPTHSISNFLPTRRMSDLAWLQCKWRRLCWWFCSSGQCAAVGVWRGEAGWFWGCWPADGHSDQEGDVCGHPLLDGPWSYPAVCLRLQGKSAILIPDSECVKVQTFVRLRHCLGPDFQCCCFAIWLLMYTALYN